MEENVRLEVEIMYRVSHPNILKLYTHFEDKERVYLVLEYCSGG